MGCAMRSSTTSKKKKNSKVGMARSLRQGRREKGKEEVRGIPAHEG